MITELSVIDEVLIEDLAQNTSNPAMFRLLASLQMRHNLSADDVRQIVSAAKLCEAAFDFELRQKVRL